MSGLDHPVREHSCEHCSCTDSRACPGGCSWSPYFLQQGRYVCSQCVKVVREAEVDRG